MAGGGGISDRHGGRVLLGRGRSAGGAAVAGDDQVERGGGGGHRPVLRIGGVVDRRRSQCSHGKSGQRCAVTTSDRRSAGRDFGRRSRGACPVGQTALRTFRRDGGVGR